MELTSNLPVNNSLLFSYLWSPFSHLSGVMIQPKSRISIYYSGFSILITGSPHLLLGVWFLSKRHHCSTSLYEHTNYWLEMECTGQQKADCDVNFGHMTVSKNSTLSRDGSRMIHPAHNPSKKWRQFGVVNSELLNTAPNRTSVSPACSSKNQATGRRV